MTKILIIEDNFQYVDFLKRLFSSNYIINSANTLEKGLQQLDETYDIVILDLRLPEIEGGIVKDIGQAAIETIKELHPLIEIVVITGTADKIQDAVKCMQLGAYDFILKNEEGVRERIKTSVKNALEQKRLKTENIIFQSKERRYAEKQKKDYQSEPDQLSSIKYHFNTLVGESSAAKSVYDAIDKIATRTSDDSVLITGETGTGKELVAAAIHFNTPGRNEKLLITADIASLTPNLVESELFGIDKGVATGVLASIGYFEEANGSTLFLDEIAQIPLNIQAKLLRVLQEKEIQRAGSTKKRKIDIRIVAATNKNLLEEVEAGSFREDLYYRLETVKLNVPSLRERLEDIPDLVDHFLNKLKTKYRNNETVFITEETKQFLQTLDWPGNIRQLENVIKGAFVSRANHEIDITAINNNYKMENHLIKNSPQETGISKFNRSLPRWDGISASHERFVKIDDKELRLQIFVAEYIESIGDLQSLKEKLQIHANTANDLKNLSLEFLFVQICRCNGDLDFFAKSWNIDKDKLLKSLKKANRMKNYLQKKLKEYKDLQTFCKLLEVDEPSAEKVMELF